MDVTGLPEIAASCPECSARWSDRDFGVSHRDSVVDWCVQQATRHGSTSRTRPSPLSSIVSLPGCGANPPCCSAVPSMALQSTFRIRRRVRPSTTRVTGIGSPRGPGLVRLRVCRDESALAAGSAKVGTPQVSADLRTRCDAIQSLPTQAGWRATLSASIANREDVAASFVASRRKVLFTLQRCAERDEIALLPRFHQPASSAGQRGTVEPMSWRSVAPASPRCESHVDQSGID